MEGLEQHAVRCEDRVIIDLGREGKMRADALLCRNDLWVSCQGW